MPRAKSFLNSEEIDPIEKVDRNQKVDRSKIKRIKSMPAKKNELGDSQIRAVKEDLEDKAKV